ncbi:MAG: hypothetical protein RR448_04945, partial [Niameybacter sp.]
VLANKINQQVSKEYEVQDKAEEMLENGSLGDVVIKLKSIDERLELADSIATRKIEAVKEDIEEAYAEMLERFYARGGMKGNVSEHMMLAEKNQAIADIMNRDDVKVLVNVVRQLEVEKNACTEALNLYFSRNKKVIMEEMKCKRDEDLREDIRQSGILDMIE